MLRDQSKVPIGYLWKKTDRQGREYFAGPLSLGILGEIPIVIFKEDSKVNDKAPDYVIRLATEGKDGQ